jgi:protein involved in polysaccharide export with SLBB domain
VTDIPGELTKEVNLWGHVNRPGRYEVPLSVDLIQLITYAGGPKEYADLDEIMVYRVLKDGTQEIIEVDLEEPLKNDPELINLFDEDTILIDFKAIVTWREIFGTAAGLLAAIASLIIIVDRIGD